MSSAAPEIPATYDLVSFDVFDTLLCRAIEAPTDVFKIVRAKLLGTDCALFAPSIVDAFPILRVEAERAARVEKHRNTGVEEVGLDEIYATLGRLSGADGETLATLRQTEVVTERELAYANPEAAILLEDARAAGKQIVICSDMYLPASVIGDLLSACRYHRGDKLFVSCEHAASKSRGDMFARVAEAHNVSLSRILHVGDDPHGDVLMAGRAGCQTRHLPRLASDPAAPSLWTQNEGDDGTVSSIVAGLVLKRRRSAPEAADPWHELGFRIFGPLFTGFLLWLKRAIAAKRPDRILLLARDTHWMRTALPHFLSDQSAPLDIRYVHVSRAALLLASMTDFSVRRLPHLFSGRTPQTVGAHLRRLGLKPFALTATLRSAGFVSADELVDNGDPRMCDLLGKLADPLLQESLRRRPIVQDYLDPFVAGVKDLMLVDIGWVGNMQASFVRLLSDRHPKLRMRGYYAGLLSSAGENDTSGHSRLGWLTRSSDPVEVERSMWGAGGVELLEFAMRAPHGTTLGYERAVDGSVAAVLEANAQEEALNAPASALQAGAAAFMEEFLGHYGGVDAQGLDSRAWGAPFYRLVTAPTAAEADLLGDITHSDNAGPSHHRLPLAPRLGQPVDSFRIGNCYWPGGFVARNGLMHRVEFDEGLYLSLYPDVSAAVEAGTFRDAHHHWLEYGQREGRITSWAAWANRQACVSAPT